MNAPPAAGGQLARIVAVYTVIRLVVFLVVLGVLLPLDVYFLAKLAIAFVVSAVMSYPLARRQREDVASALEARRVQRERGRRPR